MNMKKNLLLLSLMLAFSIPTFAQADKPSMMVIPDIAWFVRNNYFTEHNNNGKVQRIPNYTKAFEENSDVKEAIATLGELFQQRGFELTSLEETLSSQDQEDALEIGMAADGYGDETNMGVADQILNQYKPDIKLTVDWQTSEIGFQKQLRVTVRALDSYTNKQIGNLTNTTPPMARGAFLADMIKQSVSAGFDNLTNNMMIYFQGLQSKGREVRMAVRVTANSSVTLFDQVGDDRLNMVLQKWVRQHSKNGTGNTAGSPSRARMNFQNIRIPLTDQYGQKMTAYEWATNEGLEAYLKSLGVSARVDENGIGSITVRIGAN